MGQLDRGSRRRVVAHKPGLSAMFSDPYPSRHPPPPWGVVLVRFFVFSGLLEEVCDKYLICRNLFRANQEIQSLVAAQSEKRWHRLRIRFWLRNAFNGAMGVFFRQSRAAEVSFFLCRWVHYSEKGKNTGKRGVRRKRMDLKRIENRTREGGLTNSLTATIRAARSSSRRR